MDITLRVRGAARALCLAWAASAAGILPAWAGGGAYPDHPVRIIVPAAPGGGIDLTARAYGMELSKLWGQSVVVENKPGANAIVGADAAAHATPDGYTLLVASASVVTINPLVYPRLPYDPGKDLLPVMLLATGPSVLMVNKSLPVRNVPELVAYLKAHPGKLNHATNTTSTILASEMFKSLAQVDYVDINYKGAALAVQSTLAGDTQFCIVDTGSASAYLHGEGNIRPLAVTTPQRFKLLPELPTLDESGLHGYVYTANVLMFAPAGTPAAVLAKISRDLRKVVTKPELVKAIEGINNEPSPGTMEETRKALDEDRRRWADLVRARHISFQ